jgi:hypothetical protein
MHDLIPMSISQLQNASVDDMRAVVLSALMQREEFEFKLHPLGFWACNLVCRDGMTSRCHVWPSRSQGAIPEFSVHNHVFDFGSRTVFGALEHFEFVVSPGTEVQCDLIYEVAYDSGRSILRKTERRVTLNPSNTYVTNVGDYYSVCGSRFHSTQSISNGGTATLLVAENTDRAFPEVIGRDHGEASIEFNRYTIPPDLTIALASKWQREMWTC